FRDGGSDPLVQGDTVLFGEALRRFLDGMRKLQWISSSTHGFTYHRILQLARWGASLHPMLAMLSLLTWPHSQFGNWTRKPRPACGFAPPTTAARWKKKRVRSCAPL